MQVVDAGDLTIEQLISTLLGFDVLAEVLGRNSVACLVLARQALMPDFFNQVIANVHTIDGCLRQHVEFIVFHGGASTVSIRKGGTEYRYRANGFAFSRNLQVGHLRHPRQRVHFDVARADELRWNGGSPTAQATARTTEASVTILKDYFRLSEAELPCLVFVDAGNAEGKPLVIPLSSDNPVGNLYTGILSDAFAKFEAHWESAAALEEAQQRTNRTQLIKEHHERLVQEAQERFAAAQADLDSLTNDLSGRRERIDALENERQQLRELKSRYRAAKTIGERVALVTTDHSISPIIQECLTELALCQTRLATLANVHETFVIEKQITKLTNRALSIIGKMRLNDEHRLIEIAKSFKALGLPRSDLVVAVGEARNAIAENMKQALLCANELTARLPSLYEDRLRAEKNAAVLRAEGYSDELLSVTRYGARALVGYMLAMGRLGIKKKVSFMGVKLRVLLLTSAPTDQAPLDLEEEIRSIEEQVRGARLRDNIRLITGPAARPDDLVRLLSQYTPQVIHFSGHGSPDGIVLRGDNGAAFVAKGPALERLFQNRGVRLVVLNSCYSEAQAKAIAATGIVVLGTTDAVYDEAARRFSAAFYRAIANGMSIKDAFRDGGTAVDLYDYPDVYKLIGNADFALLDERTGSRSSGGSQA